MKIENQYIIAFKGLSEGSHDFLFNIGKSFIEDYEFLEARNGELEAKVNLIKNAVQLTLLIEIHGFIEVPCDRCLEFFSLEINFQGNLYVKFSEAAGESDPEVMILHPEEGQLDLRQFFFESIGLSIPFRKVHPEDAHKRPSCNPEMLSRLEKHIIPDRQNENPAWDKLKDLL